MDISGRRRSIVALKAQVALCAIKKSLAFKCTPLKWEFAPLGDSIQIHTLTQIKEDTPSGILFFYSKINGVFFEAGVDHPLGEFIRVAANDVNEGGKSQDNQEQYAEKAQETRDLRSLAGGGSLEGEIIFLPDGKGEYPEIGWGAVGIDALCPDGEFRSAVTFCFQPLGVGKIVFEAPNFKLFRYLGRSQNQFVLVYLPRREGNSILLTLLFGDRYPIYNDHSHHKTHKEKH